MRLHYNKHHKSVHSEDRLNHRSPRPPRRFPYQALRRIFRHKCPKNRLIKMLTSQGGGR